MLIFKIDPLAPGAGVNILALMFFPDPEDLPARVKFNGYVAQHNQALQQQEETGVRPVLETAFNKQFDNYMTDHLMHGRLAGEILNGIRAMHEQRPDLEGGVSKVTFLLAQNPERRNGAGRRIPRDESYLRKDIWKRYQSVSHLWAAGAVFNFDYLSITNDDNKDRLLRFLAVAEDMRRFGVSHTTRHGPTLSDETTWRVETGMSLPSAKVECPPIPERV